MSLFFFLIVLLAVGIIYMLYYIFSAQDNAPARSLPQETEPAAAEYDTVKQQLAQNIEELNKAVLTTEELKQQIHKLIEEKYLAEINAKELSDKLKEAENQSGAKIKSLQDQIQEASGKLKIKEEQINRVTDRLEEERALLLKKEELMHQKIEDSQEQLRQAGEDFKKQISQAQAELVGMAAKNEELTRQLKVKEEEDRGEMGDEGRGMKDEGRETRDVSDEDTGKVHVRQQQLLDYLKENEKITRKEYCDKFNVSLPTAARDLKEMQDKGLIMSLGPSSRGRYFVLKG